MTGIDVPVKIYTNDGEDHFLGFRKSNPELTLVFKLNIGWEDPYTGRFPFDLLEFVFEETNIGDTEFAQEYRRRGLRSVSVGDVVVCGETAFACESIGWKKISTEDLENNVIADDTEEEEND
jgi:hypothetical protein